MKDVTNLKELFETRKIVTTKEIIQKGYTNSDITQFIKNKIIERVKRGEYSIINKSIDSKNLRIKISTNIFNRKLDAAKEDLKKILLKNDKNLFGIFGMFTVNVFENNFSSSIYWLEQLINNNSNIEFNVENKTFLILLSELIVVNEETLKMLYSKTEHEELKPLISETEYNYYEGMQLDILNGDYASALEKNNVCKKLLIEHDSTSIRIGIYCKLIRKVLLKQDLKNKQINYEKKVLLASVKNYILEHNFSEALLNINKYINDYNNTLIPEDAWRLKKLLELRETISLNKNYKLEDVDCVYEGSPYKCLYDAINNNDFSNALKFARNCNKINDQKSAQNLACYKLLLEEILSLNNKNVSEKIDAYEEFKKYIEEGKFSEALKLLDIYDFSIPVEYKNIFKTIMSYAESLKQEIKINNENSIIEEVEENSEDYYIWYKYLFEHKLFDDAKKAILKYEELLKKESRPRSIEHHLGRIELGIKSLDEDPKVLAEKEQLIIQAHDFYKSRDYTQALECSLKFIELDHKLSAMGHIIAGRCYTKLFEYDKATSIMFEGLEINKEPNTYFALGNVQFIKKEYYEAIFYYEMYNKAKPKDNPTVYKKIGECYLALKEDTKALTNFKIAEEISKQQNIGLSLAGTISLLKMKIRQKRREQTKREK